MPDSSEASNRPLTIVAIGAHPDDCEITVGGCCTRWAREGHNIVYVSVTNGDAGHQTSGGIELARRRRAEAQAAAAVIGARSIVLDHHDGELEPTLANRKTLIRLIRNLKADVVFTHRPNDYHPDHRYTSQLVQDAAFSLTVPNICTDTPAMRVDPAILYMHDHFTRPAPHRRDIVVPIDEWIDAKLDQLHCHTSQFYEWLPYHRQILDQVPEGEADRRVWLAEWLETSRFTRTTNACRDRLAERIGKDAADQVRFVEAFECCEYGSPLDLTTRRRLFGEL